MIGGCSSNGTKKTPEPSALLPDNTSLDLKQYTDKKFDTIVIGAGLSGLNAAMMLQEAGQDVLVLEGRKRLGGRVYTLDHVPGKPEAAGEYVGANYARMRNALRSE